MKKFLLSLAVALASVLSVSAEDFKCVQKESEGEIFTSELEDGAIVVTSASGAKQDWDTQFWIVLPEPVAADTKIDVAFDYKASDAIKIGTQAHGIPGGYHHWQACGEVSFTSDWQSFKNSFTVTSEMTVKNADTPDDVEGFQSIAFNLSVDREKEVVYYFKNVKVTVDGTEYTYATEAEEPGEEPAATDMALKVTCPEVKANPWDSQVFINFPEPLEAGVMYTLLMDVKGSVALEAREGQYGPEAIQPIVQDANSDNKDEWGGPADLQYLPHFALTTEWVKDVKECGGEAIVTDGEFPYSRLLLNLGLYAGDIFIDNIRLVDEEGNEVCKITFDTEEEQALVENGWMNLPKEFVADNAPSGIASVNAAAGDAAAFNLFGQKSNGAGFTIKAGKVYLVK